MSSSPSPSSSSSSSREERKKESLKKQKVLPAEEKVGDEKEESGSVAVVGVVKSDTTTTTPEVVAAASLSLSTSENYVTTMNVARATTGIFHKLKQLDDNIKELEEQIKALDDNIKEQEQIIQAKQVEIDQITDDENNDLTIALLREKNALLVEKNALRDKKDNLDQEKNSFRDKKENLVQSFLKGLYYAEMSEYWKVAAGKATQKNHWDTFVREETMVHKIQCRTTDKPAKYYSITREKALNNETHLAASNTTTHSASTQKWKHLRNTIWPVDIFGNQAKSQEISHILPCGKSDCKEWIEVSAAAMGLSRSQPLVVKQKALRGVVKKDGSRNQESRNQETGLVHFTSNKLRLKDQKLILDGNNPRGMIIPVLNVDQAKQWQGQAYDAIFVLGLPKDAGGMDHQDLNVASDYCEVQLNSDKVIASNVTRDALPEEVETARQLLCQAILALGQLVQERTDDEIEDITKVDEKDSDETKSRKMSRRELLKQRRQVFADRFNLPEKVEEEDRSINSTAKRPICLVSFSSVDETDGHPAPDPLLLVLKAANIWGCMVNMPLLANGKECDPYENMSDGDFLAEEAFYEWKFGAMKDPSFEELARGLGQPNGYQGEFGGRTQYPRTRLRLDQK
jgi:hypothetical protein